MVMSLMRVVVPAVFMVMSLMRVVVPAIVAV